MFDRVAILTSKESWFVQYARHLVKLLTNKDRKATLFFKYEDIPSKYEPVFILSYFKMIDASSLKKHQHNLVIHESGLPKGKGWAPLFWQILEGKNIIPIVMIEADKKMDAGQIYIKDHIRFNGTELYEELREAQAMKTIELCMRFIKEYKKLNKKRQIGKSTYYKRRIQKDSQLDINKSIKNQINLLRISDNKNFPTFFFYKDIKYIVNIFKEKGTRRHD